MSNRLPAEPPGPESDIDPPNDVASALAALDGWGAHFAAGAVSAPSGLLGTHGATSKVVAVASLTKLTTAWAVLLSIEEGAVDLEEPFGPPGATVAHVLCHASGWDFDSQQILAAPGTRRIYSNTGYEALATHLADKTGIAFADYLAEGVLDPLGMKSTELRGSAAKGLFSSVEDLLTLIEEFRRPVLLDATTASRAQSVQMPGLDGVLPGWGPQHPCDWGYGPELRGNKSPHWSGLTADTDTFGHFGGSGTMLWIDPRTGIGCVALSDREFGEWSLASWPAFSDGVRAAARVAIN